MRNSQGYFSRTFKDLKLQYPGLSWTKVLFQDFPDSGILKKKIQDFPEGMGTLKICKWQSIIENWQWITSNTAEASDELGAFLWLVGDDLQSCSKTLVVVGEPLQQRQTLNEFQLHTGLPRHSHS